MRKGEATKKNILDRALSLASACGLEGLTIGKLADELDLSKSGLFAHFQSKEVLQIQVIETASHHFTENVIRPAVRQPRGRPRLQALFDNWIEWTKMSKMLGGCIFIAASVELDDRPGPVRDRLVEFQKEWSRTRARVVQDGMANGLFREDTDPEQISHDLYGIIAAHHYAARLLRDPQAEARARASFQRLLDSISVESGKAS